MCVKYTCTTQQFLSIQLFSAQVKYSENVRAILNESLYENDTYKICQNTLKRTAVFICILFAVCFVHFKRTRVHFQCNNIFINVTQFLMAYSSYSVLITCIVGKSKKQQLWKEKFSLRIIISKKWNIFINSFVWFNIFHDYIVSHYQRKTICS